MMNGQVPRKHSLHGKTAASVLLELFIRHGNKTNNTQTVFGIFVLNYWPCLRM